MELFTREGRSSKDVHLPKEANIGEAARASLKGARLCVREDVRQDNRKAAGSAPKIHRPCDDD